MKAPDLEFLDDVERLERIAEPSREELEELERAREMAHAIQADTGAMRELLDRGNAEAQVTAGLLQRQGGNKLVGRLLRRSARKIQPEQRGLGLLASRGGQDPQLALGEARARAQDLLDRGLSTEQAPGLQIAEEPRSRLDRVRADVSGALGVDPTQEMDAARERVGADVVTRDQRLVREERANDEAEAAEAAEAAEVAKLSEARTVGPEEDPIPGQEIEEGPTHAPTVHDQTADAPARSPVEASAQSPMDVESQSHQEAPLQSPQVETTYEEELYEGEPTPVKEEAEQETEAQAEGPTEEEQASLVSTAAQARQMEEEASALEAQSAETVESEPEADASPMMMEEASHAEPAPMELEPASVELEPTPVESGFAPQAPSSQELTSTTQMQGGDGAALQTATPSAPQVENESNQGLSGESPAAAPDQPDAPQPPSGLDASDVPAIAGEVLDLADPPSLPALDEVPSGSADAVPMPPVPVNVPAGADQLGSGTAGEKLADEQGPMKDAAQVEAEAQLVGEEGKRKLAAAEAELQAKALTAAESQTSQAKAARDQATASAMESGDAKVLGAQETAAQERVDAKAEGDERASEAAAQGRARDQRSRGEHSTQLSDAQATQARELTALQSKEQAEVTAEEKRGQETLAGLEAAGQAEERAIELEGARERDEARAWAQRSYEEVRAAGEAEQREIMADARARAESEIRDADARANAEVEAAERLAERELAEGEREKRRLEEEARQFKKSQPWYKRAWSWVKDKANALKDLGKAAWKKAKAVAKAAVDKAVATARTIRDVAKRAAGAIYRAADKACGGVLTRVTNKVREIGEKVGQKLRAVGKAVAQRIADAASAVRQRLSAAVRATRAAVRAIGEKILSVAASVRDACVKAIQAAGKALANAMRATARFVRDKTLQAVTFVRTTYTRIAEATRKVVTEIVREVVTRVKHAWEVASTAVVAAVTWFGEQVEKFNKWAQEAFVKFWTGPWRDIILGIAIAVMIAAITVATGGAGLVLIIGISAATGAVLRAGGEVAARRAAVAIKNDPERADRFADEMAKTGDHSARWYEGVSKDEGWGTTLKHGSVEGLKGAIEGAVIGISGAGAGMVGTRIAASMAKSAAARGAMTLGRRGMVKAAEWSTRSVVDFGMGLGGDVAAGNVLVELDVAMGYRTRDEAYQFHVGRFLSTEAMGARFAGSKLSGGLRMGSHRGVEKTVQDRLVNAVTRTGSSTTRTATQQVTRQVVDMSVGGAEGGTTAGLMSVANGGTFQDGFAMGFVGGVGSHAGRLAGEGYVRRGGLSGVASTSDDIKMKRAGLDPRREGRWRASGPMDQTEVDVDGGGGGPRQSVNGGEGPRTIPTPTELNVHQANRLNRILPGRVEGIPKGTRIVPDGAPGPLPPGAMRVSEARHYIQAVSKLRRTPTGREALSRMDQQGVKVTMERGGSYMRGAQLNVDLDSRTPQDVANVMVHESHHAATRADLPDVRRTSRKQFVDSMLRNESEAQARLLEHARESGQVNTREFGYDSYHQAYDQAWNRLKSARPDLSVDQRQQRAMEAGTVALERVFAAAVPSTSLTLDASSGQRVLRSGAPENYEQHYGQYWDRTSRADGPKKPLPMGGTKDRVADRRKAAAPDTFATKRPLEGSLNDLLASPEAQTRLYQLAQNGMAEAEPKISAIISKYKGADGVVLLKRNGRGAFIEAVAEKYERKSGKYTRVGDVGDMVRGRINLEGGASLDGLLADVQASFPRSTVDAKTDGPYPRVHVDIELDNGVRFELQVGTHATTRFLETSMVELPSSLHAKVGKTEGNFHVAKYDIVDKVTQPAMRQRYGLDAFDARYDKALKSTGSGIYNVEGTRALQDDLAGIMRRMEADDPDYLQSLYTKGSKKPTAPKQSAPSEMDMDGLEKMPMPDTDDVVRRSKPEVDVSDDPLPITLHDSDSGKKEHKAHYAAMGEDVFKKAPSIDDVNQGYLADCYLVAGMGALAKQRPELVQRMITDHGDGTVTVELHTNKNGTFAWPDAGGTKVSRIRITKELPTINGKTPTYAKGADGQLWPGLVEKAYAVHMAQSDYQGLNTGGSVGRAMEVLAGGRSEAIQTQYQDVDVLLSRLDAGLQEKKPLAAGSMDKNALKTSPALKALADEKTVYPWHAYVITDVDVKKNEVRLYNPWGSRHPKPMTIQEFQKLYRTVYVGNPEAAADAMPDGITMPSPDVDHVGARAAGEHGGSFDRTDVANPRVAQEAGGHQPMMAGEGYKKIVSGIDGQVVAEHSWVSHGPHSIGEDMAATFSGGRYARIILDRPLRLYRAWHPETSREFGAFWSLEKPKGSLQTRIDSALLPKWARSRADRQQSNEKAGVYSVPNPKQASEFIEVEVPAGVIVHVGEVANQGDGYVGGGSQVLVVGGVQPEWKIGSGELD